MKGILEFDLPEEHEEHDLALNAWKYMIVLSSFDNRMRGILKQETEDYDYDTVNKLRDELWEMLRDNNIDL